MTIGDTLYILATGDDYDQGRHLWVVISKPESDPNKIVIVNFNSIKKSRAFTKKSIPDNSCVLQPSDYPSFIYTLTYVNYQLARVYSSEWLAKKQAEYLIEMKDRVSKECLNKILLGAGKTKFLVRDIKAILIAQGLVSPPLSLPPPIPPKPPIPNPI